MYKTLKEICDFSGMKLIITEDENLKYKYTNTNKDIDFDYIFVPAVRNEKNIFKEIENHLQNNFCKGFIIPEKFIVEPEYINILNKYSPKNVLMAKSAYMAAFKIAKLNAQNFNTEIIILAGTDDIEEIKFKLSKNLGIKYIKYDTFWQMVLDPLLRADENDKFTIIQTNINAPNCSKYIADYKELSTILFSKISIRNIHLYKTIENYNEEWCRLLSNNPKQVFLTEDNDIIRLPLVQNLKITNNPVKDITESFNKNYIEIEPDKEDKPSVLINTNSFWSIKKGIKEFIENYPESKKIVVFPRIRNLGKYSKSYNLELLLMLDESFDLIILADFEDFLPYLKERNKKSTIVNFKNISNGTLDNIKKIIDYKKDENTKCLLIGKNDSLCSLI